MFKVHGQTVPQKGRFRLIQGLFEKNNTYMIYMCHLFFPLGVWDSSTTPRTTPHQHHQPSGGSGYGSGCRYQGPHSRRRCRLVTVGWWRTWVHRVLPGGFTTDGTVGLCAGSTHGGPRVAWSLLFVGWFFLRLRYHGNESPWKTTSCGRLFFTELFPGIF